MAIYRNNINKFAKGAGIALAARFLGRFLNVVGDIIVARILGAAVFGLYAVGRTFFRLVELIAPLGYDLGVLNFGERYFRKDERSFRSVVVQSFFVPFLIGGMIGGITFAFAPQLAVIVFKKPGLIYIFRFFAFAFPLAAVLPVIASATRLTQDMRYSAIAQDFGQPAIGLFFLLLLYLLGVRLDGVLFSTVFSYGVAVAGGGYFLWKLFPHVFAFRDRFDLSAGGLELFSFSFYSSLVTIFTTMVIWVDRLFVAYFLSAKETGIYQAASQLSVFFVLVLGGINRMTIPMFVRLYQEERKSMLEEIYRVSTKWGIYLGLPVFLVLLLSPSQVLTALYGSDYQSGAAALTILLIGQFFNLTTGAVGPLLVVTGYHKIMLRLSFAALVLCLGFNGFLIPRIGLSGAAWATVISLVFLYLTSLFAAKAKLHVWPYDGRYWKGIVAALGTAPLVWILRF
ncbi:MAG: oligosaccharide flippase family protein, partial [Chloroflexi bacterium]|nr:oligosaccharide flippase family protein [Chloroflexota bacterium]